MVWGAPVAAVCVRQCWYSCRKKELTVLAGDGSKVKDVKLAALGGPATAKGRVGLGNNDGGAGGEGEDGREELHVDGYVFLWDL